MLKAFLAAALLALGVSGALAQSSPGLTYGQVPTAGQWNGYFAAKQDVLGYVPLNSAGGTMTGRLTTAASQAGSSGFRLTPGIAPAAPVDGDMWSTSGGLFIQINGATVGPIVGGIVLPVTDMAIARFSGTSGALQNSGVIIDNSDNVTGVAGLTASGAVTPASNDGAALGSTALQWSDLFLASGGVLNWANGNAAITHSSGILNVTTGDLRVTAPGTNAQSVATLSGTQTLTNKTLTSPVIASIVNSGTLTLPTSTDTLVGRATTDTLSNKTLTAPVISTITNTGTLTLPTSTDTLVGRATTDTLTNKTVTQPTITLKQGTSPTPTAEGDIQWDTDDDALVIGNGASQTVIRASSGWSLVSTQNVSGVASVTWTGLGSCRQLALTGWAQPATDGTFAQLRTSSNNGSSYDSGASDYSRQTTISTSTNVTTAAATAAAALLSGGTGNTGQEATWFEMNWYQFNQATYGFYTANVGYLDTNTVISTASSAGYRAQATARNALQFMFSTGNIASGSLSLSCMQ